MSWEEITILEIDSILELCKTNKTTTNEIERLEKQTDEPTNLCERYEVVSLLFGMRSEYDANIEKAVKILMEISKADGCTIETPQTVVPEVNIYFVGGSI
jgi:hypothetical protein